MDFTDAPYETIHATAIIIKECGVLIRGKSGAGKSSLALSLIDQAKSRGLFSELVSDDRVRLFATQAYLIALSHPAIEGLIELRGIGILPIAYEKSCVLRLVIDIEDNPPRLPDPKDEMIEISGIKLFRMKSKIGGNSAGAIMHSLKIFDFFDELKH